MTPEEELEILHPRYHDQVKLLRDIADKIVSGEYIAIGAHSERKVKGRKYKKFTGDVELHIQFHVPALAGIEELPA